MLLCVQLFGSVAAHLKVREINVDWEQPEISVTELLDHIQKQHPTLKSMRNTLAVAVNMAYVGSDHIVHDGDEVAIIPPVSGG
jgi:molybdopterin converting factor subunit 1